MAECRQAILKNNLQYYWYDFLFNPELIFEFLDKYKSGELIDPTPQSLLSTFIKRITQMDEDNEGEKRNSQRMVKLAELSFIIAGDYYFWSQSELSKVLPIVTQYQLMDILIRIYPASDTLEDSISTDSSYVTQLSDSEIIAQFLYMCWVLKFYSTTTETEKNSPEYKTFINEIKPLEAASVLQQLLLLNKDLIPSNLITYNELDKYIKIPFKHIILQSAFELGRYNFSQMEHVKAFEYFTQADQIYHSITQFNSHTVKLKLIWFEYSTLQAFIDSLTLVVSNDPLPTRIAAKFHAEHYLRHHKYQQLIDLILKGQGNNQQLHVTFFIKVYEYMRRPELYGFVNNDNNTNNNNNNNSSSSNNNNNNSSSNDTNTSSQSSHEPSPKRAKIEKSSQDCQWRLLLTVALYLFIHGYPAIEFRLILRKIETKDEVEFYNKISNKFYPAKRKDSLQSNDYNFIFQDKQDYMHKLCKYAATAIPKEKKQTINILFKVFHVQPPKKEFLEEPDVSTIHITPPKPQSLTAEPTQFTPEQLVAMFQTDMLDCEDPQTLLKLVKQMFNVKGIKDWSSIVNEWVGPSNYFIKLDQISDHTQVLKINSLVHLGSLYRKRCMYQTSYEFFVSALEMCKKATSKTALTIPIHEELIYTELMGDIARMKESVGTITSQNKLIESAKNVFNKTTNPHLFTVATVYLLNCNEFEIFASSPGNTNEFSKLPIGLANACLTLNESGEIRRHVKQIFDAIYRVTEDYLEPQRDGRNCCLQIFLENLLDHKCLSLIISCLVKLITLTENPKYEISCEFPNCWPITAPSLDRIEKCQPNRLLLSALDHAIELYPKDCVSWLITRADYEFNKSKYNLAMKFYMEAGANCSELFFQDVPQEVWNEQTLRRMLDCLCLMNEHYYALLLSQLMKPIDYALAFNIIKSIPRESCNNDDYYECLWDLTLLEYLAYTLSQRKQEDEFKKVAKCMSADLNVNNPEEVLKRAHQRRRNTFINMMVDQFLLI